ncbi:MAG: Ldh family oxidoreductase [Bacteroidales bacterium]|nr:Ldh family oxidoreductase [Bacteroidales bacterium]
MPTYSADALIDFANRLFITAGVPAEEAATVAYSLVDANLCGHDSHGILRAPQYVGFIKEGKYRPGAPLEILSETPAVVAADAGWGLGQVQSHRLLDRLIPRAHTLGIAAGSLRHSGHTGRLGEYAERAAREKLALFATVNSHGAGRRVAPPGGTAGRISTNPICLGVPTDGPPVVLDFGTSAAAEGKVRSYFQKGEPTPEGWLLDSAGKPTTDPSVLYKDPRGTILPFGGPQMYKGFGLGLLLDMLAGGLSGGSSSHPDAPLAGVGNTAVFTLFDPARFGGIDHFMQETTRLAAFVRGCPPADPTKPITLPGDPERLTKEARLRDGIVIPDGTWELLRKCAEELGVALP